MIRLSEISILIPPQGLVPTRGRELAGNKLNGNENSSQVAAFALIQL